VNRIRAAFEGSNKKLLSLYVMAGFPSLDDTAALCRAAVEAGADMLEIGIPFSDPIADGETIQRASERALKNGFTIEHLFGQIKDLRKSVSVPLILMGYLNPVLQYGVEKFCKNASACGIDGLILPDLPVEDYREQYRDLFKSHGLSLIFLVTARTEPERVKYLDQHSEGFLYLVSSEATTGGTLAVGDGIQSYFERIASMKLNNPLVVGFGIADNESFSRAVTHTNGAIVASAFLRRLETEGTSPQVVTRFVHEIRGIPVS
jgi:tryptophan synthase alpha chain